MSKRASWYICPASSVICHHSTSDSLAQYPQWLGRRDKRGIPLYLFEVAPLNSKNISAYEKDLAKSKTTIAGVATKNIRLFALYESLTRFVTPLCSMVPRNHPETPISQSNNIVDISGVGLKQFWNLKGHMQDASVLATAHYPETLDRIFVWSTALQHLDCELT